MNACARTYHQAAGIARLDNGIPVYAHLVAQYQRVGLSTLKEQNPLVGKDVRAQAWLIAINDDTWRDS
jgi:hypothetical protein